MLPSERRRRDDTARREAAGESLWTPDFDQRSRNRIAEVWKAFANEFDSHLDDMTARVSTILRVRGGWSVRAFDDNSIRVKDIPTDFLLDALAATAAVIEEMGDAEARSDFEDFVNTIMNEHRIAHKFVDGDLIPFESDELLQAVVEPALHLLIDKRFEAAHASYMKALQEISNNDPGDAITDAGTALQETLTALGCEGDVLSKLIADAKVKGLFKSHDTQLHEAVILMTKWAASERNKNSDAHKNPDATLADAWLMVHVVGAVIVRLADDTLRGTAAPD